MFANTIYLFGNKYAPEAKMLDFKETLADGSKVNQKKLAEQTVLAAFIYLYSQKLIDLSVVESKKLFLKSKNAKAKKLQNNAADLSGLEAQLYSLIADDTNVDAAVRGLFRTDVTNPWGGIIDIVKNDLAAKGIIEKAEAGKILFIKTHKDVLANGIPAEENEKLSQYEQASAAFKSQTELYDKVLLAISDTIASRQQQSTNND